MGLAPKSKKPQVILLSDTCINSGLSLARYVGPYALASRLEAAGFRTLVIDRFTRLTNPIDYIADFFSTDLLAVGVSSTFLYARNRDQAYSGSLTDEARRSTGELWLDSPEQAQVWFDEIKRRMLAATAGRALPRSKPVLLLGGSKATRVWENPNAYRSFDAIGLGPADDTLVQLVSDLANDREVPYRQEGGIQLMPKASSLKNKIPCPDAMFSPKHAIAWGEALPIEVSRGCIFNCKFCHYEKKDSIRKDLDLLRTEFIRNYELFGTTVYHFADDCFNDSRGKVEALCELFLSLPFKIEWVSYARVDVAIKFPETARLMVESGASGLYWGIESLDGETARRAGKGTPVELVKDFAVNFKRDYGDRCLSAGSFIVGLPGETETSIQQTIDWLIEKKPFDFVQVGSLTLTRYNQKLDGDALDYADYSRNPEKYGFDEVRYIKGEPAYWRHAQMDSYRAEELAKHFSETWIKFGRTRRLQTVWDYPHFRTIGLDKNQILNSRLSDLEVESLTKTLRATAQAKIDDYFVNLKAAWLS